MQLSPSVTGPGRSGGRGRSSSGRASTPGTALLQRGGRGGAGASEPGAGEAGAPVRAEEMAARRVLLGFQEIPTGVSIAATAGSVTVKENSGQGTFAVNGKTLELPVDGAAIKAKMKWARAGRNDDEDPGRAGRLRSPVGTNMTRVPIGP